MRSRSLKHQWLIPPGPLGRSGATLTEVLMAILIMAVGVVSVFTLFPISVLRTIQATNQTNAKILKENVEEQIAQSPLVLSAFNAVSPANPLAAAAAVFRNEWQANANYAPNAIIVPTIKPGTRTQRSLALLINTAAAAGNSGAVEPVWNPTVPTITDGAVQWQRLGTLPGNIRTDRYVVDPLGWNTAGTDRLTDIQDFFGNRTDSTGAVAPTPRGLLRFNGSFATPQAAADFCVHPDSWQELFSAIPVNVGANSVEFPGNVDLTGFFPAGPAVAFPRVVITSLDGKQTMVRELTGPPAGQVVTWSAAEPFPARFPVADVGTARIEVFNRRYTWFLTVRNVGARPEVKCVVTFNRGFNSAEEHTYATNFGNPDLDANNNSTVDSAEGLTANNQIMVCWQPDGTAGFDPEVSGTDNINEPEPLLKAGNWLFDARDVSWYRIQSIDVESPNAARPQWKIISVDRSVRTVTPDDNAGPPSLAQPIGRSMLLPGIVEVFDL